MKLDRLCRRPNNKSFYAVNFFEAPANWRSHAEEIEESFLPVYLDLLEVEADLVLMEQNRERRKLERITLRMKVDRAKRTAASHQAKRRRVETGGKKNREHNGIVITPAIGEIMPRTIRRVQRGTSQK
jgi:hypothetical protein